MVWQSFAAVVQQQQQVASVSVSTTVVKVGMVIRWLLKTECSCPVSSSTAERRATVKFLSRNITSSTAERCGGGGGDTVILC